MKTWVIESFLMFDSMDRSVTIHWKAAEQYFTVDSLSLNFIQFVVLENSLILDLALLGVKVLRALNFPGGSYQFMVL